MRNGIDINSDKVRYLKVGADEYTEITLGEISCGAIWTCAY